MFVAVLDHQGIVILHRKDKPYYSAIIKTLYSHLFVRVPLIERQSKEG